MDPGSIYKDEYEKTYNLDFAFTLKEELEDMGATVMMTRSGDYDLSSPDAYRRKKSDFDNRIKLIDNNKADLYISLHMNYINNTKYYGSQAFFSDVNKNNEHLASILQKNFNAYFKFDKEYKKIGSDKYMYGKIKQPGVLIEYGFISSYKDREKLKNDKYRSELSKVIGASLVEYFT